MEKGVHSILAVQICVILNLNNKVLHWVLFEISPFMKKLLLLIYLMLSMFKFLGNTLRDRRRVDELASPTSPTFDVVENLMESPKAGRRRKGNEYHQVSCFELKTR
jgi:hypothetical protein